MKGRKKILITGGSFINKGAEAMALTVQKELQTAFPDSKIWMKVDPLYFQIALDNKFNLVNARPPVTWFEKIRSKISTLRHYLFDDAIIDIGGYQFGDPWGWKNTKGVIKRIKLCNIFKTKTIFMPQAMGPFAHEKFQEFIPSIINDSTLFFIRDRQSFEEVKKICPVDASRLYPDIAWNFNVDDIKINEILTKYKIDRDKETVCVTPNLRVYERQGEAYISVLHQMIELLIEKHYQVILLGHELRINQQEKDDRFLCRFLKEKSPRTIHIDQFYNAKQIKKIIGICDFVISSRYHALIAALSQMIPALVIGWSYKYDQLLMDVGLSNNMLRINDLSHGKNVEDIINKFIDGLDHQRIILNDKVPNLIISSKNMCNQVLNILSA